MLTWDEVVWGYRYVLGRDPESTEVIERHRRVPSWNKFRDALLRSPEFSSQAGQLPTSPTWVIAEVMRGSRLMWIDLSDRYVSLGCLRDSYEPIESTFVASNLSKNSTFLDIGANIGWYTILSSTIVGPAGHIHCFEPRQDTAAHLARTIKLNGLDKIVTSHSYGLSVSQGHESLVWPKGTENPGGTALLRGSSQLDLMESQAIEVKPLDDLKLPVVDFIKIDIEGAELLAMKGGEETIDRTRPIVLSEVYPAQLANVSGASTDDYFGFFLSRDYRAFIVDANRCGEEIWSYPVDWQKGIINVGFIPNERLAAGQAVLPRV